MSYYINPKSVIAMRREVGGMIAVHSPLIVDAINDFDAEIDKLIGGTITVAEILGMRNLSSFVGELFSAVIIKRSGGFFRKNPHQDGYPDLLLMDEVGAALWESLKGRYREKGPFSPFLAGGIEVKATCGSVAGAKDFVLKGLNKPGIGDQRRDLLRGYDWKAHHRETNNLLGLLWDFVDAKPKIIGIFYSSQLEESDWGEIVKPRDGGGRTTSVSIMTRAGVKKMYEGWIMVWSDPAYIRFIDKYNKGSLLEANLPQSGLTQELNLID